MADRTGILRPRICLCMIVKDESAIILRCLESVADYIDYWVISDTGSSDDTKKVVAAFFSKLGIPGEFSDRPFDTFEAARNHALDAARQSRGEFDYILLMDADMELRVVDPQFRSKLKAAIYAIQQRAGISYWNARLLRRDATNRYRGVTHEYIEDSGSAQCLEGVWFADCADGANREGKFERDIELLRDGLEREPDNARYVYYLAQSYRDAGRLELAAETYARRFSMGGWDEERWSALLNEARCHLRLGQNAQFLEAAEKAFSFRPTRAEPLLDLAQFLRSQGEYEQAMMFCELATHILWPAEDRLFIEDFVYSFGIRQEISISGFYCAAEERKNLGRFAANDLALDRNAPPEVRGQARYNLTFYARSARELMPSWIGHQLSWVPPEGWRAMNPSIARIAGSHRVLLRTVNFDISNGSDYVVPDGGPVRSRNFLAALDPELGLVDVREIVAPADFPAPRFALVRGFEDLRLFDWQGALWCIAALREMTVQGWYEMLLARIDLRDDRIAVLSDWRVLNTGGERRHEKNWMPRRRGEDLEFVYSLDPVRIVDAQARLIRETVPDAALDHLRGGGQVIPFDDGWLALTHEVVLVNEKRVYLHRFIWLDSADHVRRLTEPFIFNDRGLEFAAGLAWSTDSESLFVTFGAKDSEAWLATVSAADVRAAMSSDSNVATWSPSTAAEVPPSASVKPTR